MTAPALSPSSFEVCLSRDEESALWVAVCDAIPFATEADTLDRLVARISEIAPEMAVLNGLAAKEGDVRLHLVLEMNMAAQAS